MLCVSQQTTFRHLVPRTLMTTTSKSNAWFRILTVNSFQSNGSLHFLHETSARGKESFGEVEYTSEGDICGTARHRGIGASELSHFPMYLRVQAVTVPHKKCVVALPEHSLLQYFYQPPFSLPTISLPSRIRISPI